MQSNSNIILIGFMGCGKTSIGKELAEQLNYTFIDADTEIEKLEKMPIYEIFKSKGEKYFRGCETNFLKKLNQKKIVLATGGGMPCYNDNMKILKQKGVVFFLEAPLNILMNRIKKDTLTRPLALQGIKKMEELYKQRKSTYLTANYKMSARGKIEDICEDILLQLL